MDEGCSRDPCLASQLPSKPLTGNDSVDRTTVVEVCDSDSLAALAAITVDRGVEGDDLCAVRVVFTAGSGVAVLSVPCRDTGVVPAGSGRGRGRALCTARRR